jgi:hypothetical protein
MIGISEICWPGSVQKTRGDGLKVRVLVCAVAGMAEPSAIRAIRGADIIAGLLKAFSKQDQLDARG